VAHADMAFKRMRSRRCSAERSTAAPPPRRRRHLQDLRNRLIVNTVDLNSGMQVFWGLEGLDEVLVRTPCSPPAAAGYLPPREIRGRFYMTRHGGQFTRGHGAHPRL